MCASQILVKFIYGSVDPTQLCNLSHHKELFASMSLRVRNIILNLDGLCSTEKPELPFCLDYGNIMIHSPHSSDIHFHFKVTRDIDEASPDILSVTSVCSHRWKIIAEFPIWWVLNPFCNFNLTLHFNSRS